MSRAACDRQAMRAIRPGISNRVHRNSDQRTIPLNPTAHAHNHWMAETPSRKLLLSAILDTHRLARLQCQNGRNWLQQHLLLAAKAPTYTRLDNTQLRDGQLQYRRKLATRMIRYL